MSAETIQLKAANLRKLAAMNYNYHDLAMETFKKRGWGAAQRKARIHKACADVQVATANKLIAETKN